MQVLPKKDFVDLANHIICGDQVIIRGSDVATVTSLLMVLKVIAFLNMLETCCCFKTMYLLMLIGDIGIIRKDVLTLRIQD